VGALKEDIVVESGTRVFVVDFGFGKGFGGMFLVGELDGGEGRVMWVLGGVGSGLLRLKLL